MTKLKNIYSTIDNIRGITFSELCDKLPYHEHTIRKYLKELTKKGVITYKKLGPFKIYYTMHKFLMYYTWKERDEIYLNYIRQYEFGINLSQICRDLNMDRRTFKKDIKRLVDKDIIEEIKKANIIIYKVK